MVVLVFMLALTGLGLMSARLALGGEALARNQLDHEVAFQAAEAALRDAERDILLTNVKPANAVCSRGTDRLAGIDLTAFRENCLRGQCDSNAAKGVAKDYSSASSSVANSGEVWWPADKGGLWNDAKNKAASATSCDFNGAVPLGAFTGAPAVVAVARQPEYLLEYTKRDNGRLVFRITARGFGYRQNSEVVLQSYFLYPDV
jgi:type IV pilus assembly protein PilX